MKEQDAGSAAGALEVLIVEDEEPIALALSFIVEDEGYRALVATQGNDALDLIRKRPPALIITDLMMPHMTGSELIARLRADPRMRAHPTPIVLMTAAGAELAAESQADEVLLKPFNVATVIEILHHFLEP